MKPSIKDGKNPKLLTKDPKEIKKEPKEVKIPSGKDSKTSK